MNLPTFNLAIAENAGFWFLWLLTLIICTGTAIWAIRSPTQILGFIPVFCLTFGYFYVIQAAVVAITLTDRLQPWMFVAGQGVALASLISTLAGHYYGSRPHWAPRAVQAYDYNARNVWYAGVTLMLIGLTAQYSFSNAMYGGQADYSVSAYWYLLFYIFYPGLALCVRVYAGSREHHTPSALLILVVLGVAFLYYWVSMARRGPVFPVFIVVAYTYYLTTRRVNRVVLVSGLVFVGMVMLLFVMVRDYTSGGSAIRTDQLEQLTVQDVLFKKAQVEGDNEYLYHCAFTAATIELDRFQYGTGYLNLSIHWIPRQWWPDKPTLLDQGWFPRVSGYEVNEVTGVEMTMGAAIGSAAEAYQQFSWFVPLFWFAIGWAIGRAFAYAYLRPTILGQILYVGMISVTHWLVSQGFLACFVPMIFFTTVPLAVMYFFRERRTRAKKRRVPTAGDFTHPTGAPSRPVGMPA